VDLRNDGTGTGTGTGDTTSTSARGQDSSGVIVVQNSQIEIPSDFYCGHRQTSVLGRNPASAAAAAVAEVVWGIRRSSGTYANDDGTSSSGSGSSSRSDPHRAPHEHDGSLFCGQSPSFADFSGNVHGGAGTGSHSRLEVEGAWRGAIYRSLSYSRAVMALRKVLEDEGLLEPTSSHDSYENALKVGATQGRGVESGSEMSAREAQAAGRMVSIEGVMSLVDESMVCIRKSLFECSAAFANAALASSALHMSLIEDAMHVMATEHENGGPVKTRKGASSTGTGTRKTSTSRVEAWVRWFKAWMSPLVVYLTCFLLCYFLTQRVTKTIQKRE